MTVACLRRFRTALNGPTQGQATSIVPLVKTETPRVRNVVDATRFWVHGCEPGRVSDGSRLALCQTLSIECPSSIFFWPVYFCYSCSFLFVDFCVFVFFFCSRWSLVDVPLIFFCPADHVPDWQPRILLGMVEARSVNVKKTTTVWTPFRTLELTGIPPKEYSETAAEDASRSWSTPHSFVRRGGISS